MNIRFPSFIYLRNDKKLVYLLLSFPGRVLILPIKTIKDLWYGDVKQYKVYEVFFEAFPQFLFQLYIICDLGFYPATHENHVWLNFLKVLSLLTSYISLIFGINKYVVYRGDNFATKDKSTIVRCYFYTFFDLHFRLGFYLLNCILMKLRYLVIYAIQSIICFITCVAFKDDFKDVLSFFYVFSVNILPQCVIDQNMRVMMTLKFIYNLFDVIIINYYSLLLYTSHLHPDTFDMMNMFDLNLSRIPFNSSTLVGGSYGICHLNNNTTLIEEDVSLTPAQIPMVISKMDILTIHIPIITVLLFISSIEIIIFLRWRTTWESFMYDTNRKIDLKVSNWFLGP